MDYTSLPHTKLEISKICLGTMTWGRQNSEAEGHSQIDYAIDQGINFIDTAELYPIPAHPDRFAHTEKIIGSWLKKTGKRENVILTSKIVGKADFTKFIRTTGFEKDAIIEAVNGSLKRLNTDYIDLYQLHWPERTTNYFGKLGYAHDPTDHWKDNIHQVLETLRDLILAGKIRNVGLSNETPWGTMRFLEEAKVHANLPRMITIQNPYNLLNRSFEVGLAEVAMRSKIGLMAYSPLGFGVLSGKYIGGMKPASSRITLFPSYTRYSSQNAAKASERYYELARQHGLSPAQMALAFVISRPFVMSTIIGATSMVQLQENIASIDVELPTTVLEGIDAIHNDFPNPSP